MTMIMENQKYYGWLEQHRLCYNTNKRLNCFNTDLRYLNTRPSFKNLLEMEMVNPENML